MNPKSRSSTSHKCICHNVRAARAAMGLGRQELTPVIPLRGCMFYRHRIDSNIAIRASSHPNKASTCTTLLTRSQLARMLAAAHLPNMLSPAARFLQASQCSSATAGSVARFDVMHEMLGALFRHFAESSQRQAASQSVQVSMAISELRHQCMPGVSRL